MALKKKTNKNPYCKRSKLSKEAFERLAYVYFLEVTGRCSRETSANLLRYGENGFYISRQSLSKYFNRISRYIWDNMVIPIEPSFNDKSVLNQLMAYLYEMSDETSVTDSIVYKYLDGVPIHLKAPKAPFIRSLMYYLLLIRSKVGKGFHKNTFHLEVSRIFFICAIVEAKGIKLKSNDDFFDYYQRSKIEKVSWNALLKILKENPL